MTKIAANSGPIWGKEKKREQSPGNRQVSSKSKIQTSTFGKPLLSKRLGINDIAY